MSARFDCEPNNTRAGSYSTWLVGPGACLVCTERRVLLLKDGYNESR